MPICSPATRTLGFGESVIRETTRLAKQHQAVNLAQGLPDLTTPARLKQLVCQAVEKDCNQYAFTWGLTELRQAIAEKHAHFYGQRFDPETDVVVCCGSSEAMLSAFMAFLEPGDEVVIFAPIYENYLPDTVLNGAKPVVVTLHPPDWHLDEAELRRAFSDKTKLLILNTPNNPTGKVFTRSELQLLADLCRQYNVLCVTDEIYEHMVYDGLAHVPMATIEGMAERTITISGFSKTFCITGWRVGYAVGPAELIGPVRKVHDYATIAAPTPMQVALSQFLPETMAASSPFYEELLADYTMRRDRLCGILTDCGFSYLPPQGAYYIFADYTPLFQEAAFDFTIRLIKEAGVATVPGSSFYEKGARDADRFVRFCFPKTLDTLAAAEKQLQQWVASLN